jgi:drug/metabolite transporter (DMT)-like permease
MELHQPSGRHGLGLALAAATAVLWGFLPHSLELVLAELDAVTITWFRLGIAAAVMLAWLGARGALPRVARLNGRARGLLVVATACLAANYWSFLVGLDLTTPASAQVLIQAAPLLLALGGLVVFRERFGRGQWLGLCVLVAGLGLFFAGQLRALVSELGTYLRGTALIGLAAVTWAAYGLAQKQLLRSLSSQQIMTGIYVGCFVCFSIGAAPSSLGALSTVGWASLAFAALNTLGAYGCFAAALEHWPASRVSAVLAWTPLVALAVGVVGASVAPELVSAEAVSPVSLIGAGLVVAGSMGVALAGPAATAVSAVAPPTVPVNVEVLAGSGDSAPG